MHFIKYVCTCYINNILFYLHYYVYVFFFLRPPNTHVLGGRLCRGKHRGFKAPDALKRRLNVVCQLNMYIIVYSSVPYYEILF